MPGVCGLKVVERAKAYAAEHPNAPSLQVLDYAMQGNYNTHIAFECEGRSLGTTGSTGHHPLPACCITPLACTCRNPT